jgi:modulator of FtsH protease HflC
MRKPLVFIVAAVAIATLIALSSFFSVNQWESALVVRLGAPVAVIDKPGLKAKAPLIDNVAIFDTRLQLLEPPSEQVILGDQKRIVAQVYTRFRITDPLRFYQSLQSMETARAQLALSVDTAMRREFGQIDLPTLLSADRPAIVGKVHDDVKAKFAPLGLDVVEVRLHRADLPLETAQAIYDRMKSERYRQAQLLRAEGKQWAQEITSKADRERTIILSQAQRQAQITRGEGDAEGNIVLSGAQKGDSKFYAFYRSLQSYGKALADSGPVLLLAPDAAFLKALKSGPPEAPATSATGAK